MTDEATERTSDCDRASAGARVERLGVELMKSRALRLRYDITT